MFDLTRSARTSSERRSVRRARRNGVLSPAASGDIRGLNIQQSRRGAGAAHFQPIYPAQPRNLPIPWNGVLPTGGTVWNCLTATDFTNALAGCADNDIIVLQAGSVYEGNFTYRNRGTNGTVYIVSSTLKNGTWPRAIGERVFGKLRASLHSTTDDTASMARINTPNTGQAITVNRGASGYTTCAIEVGLSSGNLFSNSGVIIGTEAIIDGSLTVSDIPSRINWHWMYVHGEPPVHGDATDVQVSKAFIFNFQDSYSIDYEVSEIHSCADGGSGNGDTNAYGIYLGSRLLFRNGTSSSGGEQIIIGGSDPVYTSSGTPYLYSTGLWGYIPQDILIEQFHHYKPESWLYPTLLVGQKNLGEQKGALRVCWQDGLFENLYSGTGVGQVIAIEMQSVSQENRSNWLTIEDLTVRRCIIRNTPDGFSFGSRVFGAFGQLPWQAATRCRYENVLMYNCGCDPFDGTDAESRNATYLTGDTRYAVFDHCTIVGGRLLKNAIVSGMGQIDNTMVTPPPIGPIRGKMGCRYSNCIIDLGNFGATSDYQGGGQPAYGVTADHNIVFERTAQYGSGASGGQSLWESGTNAAFPDQPWNDGGTWVSELSSIHFAGGSVYSDLVNPADFALTDLFRGIASDGKDPGCDISQLPSIAAIT